MTGAKERRIAMLNAGMANEIKARCKNLPTEMQGEFATGFARLMESGKQNEAAAFVKEMTARVDGRRAQIRREVLMANWPQLSSCLENAPAREVRPLDKAIVIISESKLYEDAEVERAEKYIRENLTRQELSEMGFLSEQTQLKIWVLLGGRIEEPKPEAAKAAPVEAKEAPKAAEEAHPKSIEDECFRKRIVIQKLKQFMLGNELKEEKTVKEALILAREAGVSNATELNNIFPDLYRVARESYKEMYKEIFPHRRDNTSIGWVESNFSTPQQMRGVLQNYGVRNREEFFFLVPNAGKLYANCDRDMLAEAIRNLGKKGVPEAEEAPVPAPKPLDVVKTVLNVFSIKQDPEELLAKVLEFYGIKIKEDDQAWVPRLENAVMEFVCEAEEKEARERRKQEECRSAEARALALTEQGIRKPLEKPHAAKPAERKAVSEPIEFHGLKIDPRMVKKIAAEERLSNEEVVAHFKAIAGGFNFIGPKAVIGDGIERRNIEKNIARTIGDQNGRTQKIIALLLKRGAVIGDRKKLALEPDPGKIDGTWEHLMRDMFSQRVKIMSVGSGRGKNSG